MREDRPHPAVGAFVTAETTMTTRDERSSVIQRGATGRPPPADADPARRPGVPMYKPARTSTALAPPPLEQQPATVPVLVDV